MTHIMDALDNCCHISSRFVLNCPSVASPYAIAKGEVARGILIGCELSAVNACLYNFIDGAMSFKAIDH